MGTTEGAAVRRRRRQGRRGAEEAELLQGAATARGEVEAGGAAA